MKTQDTKSTIISLRKDKGWTQVDLAKKAGLSNAAISDIEAGKKMPRLVTLQKIANAFGMEVTELLSCGVKREGTSVKEERSSYIIDNIEKEEIREWLKKPESIPYLDFAYALSKQIPSHMLKKLKFLIDFENNGGQEK